MPPVKRKRIITARRREQNRDAQKTYRAKMKDRLLQLEGLQHTRPIDGDSDVQDEHVTAKTNSGRHPIESLDGAILETGGQDLAKGSPLSTLVLSSGTYGPVPTQRLLIQPYTSDPRLNHLTLPHISLISAGLENSLCLNITNVEALTPGFPSPFYSPNLAPTARDTGTPRLPRRDAIPHDLQPTSLQLSTPYQAWLDSIPVPSFRDGALTYLISGRVNDEHFGLSEIADDIDSGGLVCWGGHGTGTPWDARSWEARPWFWSSGGRLLVGWRGNWDV